MLSAATTSLATTSTSCPLVENVAVAGDLGLRAILRLGRIRDERLDSSPRSTDVLDRIRRLGALDERDLTQDLQPVWVLPAEELLTTPCLMHTRQRRNETGRQESQMAVDIQEGAHDHQSTY